jgi:CheY-like chemotaxis protein
VGMYSHLAKGESGQFPARLLFEEGMHAISDPGAAVHFGMEESPVEIADRTNLVMIVEDSRDDREMYTYFLSSNGFRVAAASSGEEALPKALELRPDVIVMDLWMPGMDGWEAIRRLKRNAQSRNIPVLVLTGHPYWVEWENIHGLMRKPCGPNELLKRIQDVLNRKS